MCWALEGVLCWVIGLMSSSGLDLPGDMFTENPHFHNRYLSSVRNVNASSPQNTVKKKSVHTQKTCFVAHENRVLDGYILGPCGAPGV